jgi:hypothetical protein
VLASPPPGRTADLFDSFYLGGFECSTHRLATGRRLDLIAKTGHQELARSDYDQLRRFGIQTVRDGLRWHLIELAPGRYDWSSFLPMLRAAQEARVQVIWDLCHFGWPDDIDVWSPEFVDRFARFAAAAARLIRDETAAVPIYCPMNEVSFWAWAGGDVGYLNPFAKKRGGEIKRQLVRALIAAIEAIRSADPRARFMHAEPVIHIAPRHGRVTDPKRVARHLTGQWEAFDMIAGRLDPELGGRADYLDILGVNFYPNNQWVHNSGPIPLGRHDYRPFRDILAEAFGRYGRPLVVAETGAEGSAGPSWLHYVAGEVQAAIAGGVRVSGICLYPVLDYPGWDDDRICPVGLLKLQAGPGGRVVNEPLAAELTRQVELMERQRREAARPVLVAQG